MFRVSSRKLVLIEEIEAVAHKNNYDQRIMDRILQTPCQMYSNTVKFKRIQALSTLSISILHTHNTIPSQICHCLRLMKIIYLIVKLITIQISETR